VAIDQSNNIIAYGETSAVLFGTSRISGNTAGDYDVFVAAFSGATGEPLAFASRCVKH
jgi:hypothetical protein